MTERIKLLDKSPDENTRSLFDAAVAMLGRVPNSYRVLGRVPHLAKLLMPFSAKIAQISAMSWVIYCFRSLDLHLLAIHEDPHIFLPSFFLCFPLTLWKPSV